MHTSQALYSLLLGSGAMIYAWVYAFKAAHGKKPAEGAPAMVAGFVIGGLLAWAVPVSRFLRAMGPRGLSIGFAAMCIVGSIFGIVLLCVGTVQAKGFSRTGAGIEDPVRRWHFRCATMYGALAVAMIAGSPLPITSLRNGALIGTLIGEQWIVATIASPLMYGFVIGILLWKMRKRSALAQRTRASVYSKAIPAIALPIVVGLLYLPAWSHVNKAVAYMSAYSAYADAFRIHELLIFTWLLQIGVAGFIWHFGCSRQWTPAADN